MTRPSLTGFFAEMEQLLLTGARSATEVEDALGPSPSGTRRLALYRTLVARQRREVLTSFYSLVEDAARAVNLIADWNGLVDEYLRTHVPTHWEPNHFCEGFVEYLGAHAGLPPYLEELADYSWIRFKASIAEPSGNDVGMNRSLFVRRYAHDVLAFASEEQEAGRRTVPPRQVASTLLVFWSRTQHRVLVMRPSQDMLVAIKRRHDGEAFESDKADAELVAIGALGARTGS